MMILDPGVPLSRVAAIASMSCLRTLLGLVNRRCVLSLPCALLAHSSLVSVFLALVPHRTDAARGATRTQTAAAAAVAIDRKCVSFFYRCVRVNTHSSLPYKGTRDDVLAGLRLAAGGPSLRSFGPRRRAAL